MSAHHYKTFVEAWGTFLLVCLFAPFVIAFCKDVGRLITKRYYQWRFKRAREMMRVTTPPVPDDRHNLRSHMRVVTGGRK
jgi:hypothetical protein